MSRIQIKFNIGLALMAAGLIVNSVASAQETGIDLSLRCDYVSLQGRFSEPGNVYGYIDKDRSLTASYGIFVFKTDKSYSLSLFLDKDLPFSNDASGDVRKGIYSVGDNRINFQDSVSYSEDLTFFSHGSIDRIDGAMKSTGRVYSSGLNDHGEGTLKGKCAKFDASQKAF